MRRLAWVIRLLPDTEGRYRELHSAVWPGVIDALRWAHVINYSIFLRGGYLFSYLRVRGGGPPGRLRRTGRRRAHPAVVAPDEWWAPATELFHLD